MYDGEEREKILSFISVYSLLSKKRTEEFFTINTKYYYQKMRRRLGVVSWKHTPKKLSPPT
jgi:hypothetical protein